MYALCVYSAVNMQSLSGSLLCAVNIYLSIQLFKLYIMPQLQAPVSTLLPKPAGSATVYAQNECPSVDASVVTHQSMQSMYVGLRWTTVHCD